MSLSYRFLRRSCVIYHEASYSNVVCHFIESFDVRCQEVKQREVVDGFFVSFGDVNCTIASFSL